MKMDKKTMKKFEELIELEKIFIDVKKIGRTSFDKKGNLLIDLIFKEGITTKQAVLVLNLNTAKFLYQRLSGSRYKLKKENEM